MGKVFSSDVFDWARDLAVIHRIFGSSPRQQDGDLVPLRTIRPSAVPEEDGATVEPVLVEIDATENQ